MTVTIEGLKETLDQVVQELTFAAHIDDVYWQVNAIIQANPEINKPNAFLDWLVFSYVDSITVRLRRLADKGKKTISLWRLLENMKNIKPEVATKTNIKAKQQELTHALVRVETYANSLIAHRAKRPQIAELTYEEVRKALGSAFKVFNWCAQLLTNSIWLTAVPTITENWLAIFKVPWLKDRALPTYIHLDTLLKENRQEEREEVKMANDELGKRKKERSIEFIPIRNKFRHKDGSEWLVRWDGWGVADSSDGNLPMRPGNGRPKYKAHIFFRKVETDHPAGKEEIYDICIPAQEAENGNLEKMGEEKLQGYLEEAKKKNER